MHTGRGGIKITHRQAIVLLLIFRHHCIKRRSYYLVYDSTDASLSVIPYIPRELEAIYRLAAIPVRGAGGGAGLKLALMARTRWPQDDRGRLCVCALSAAQPSPKPDGTAGPWQVMVHRFPKLHQSFSADVVFSCHRKVFWADPSLPRRRVKRPGRRGLSRGHRLHQPARGVPDRVPPESSTGPARMSQTMGCVEDSIKFICIDRRPGNEAVKVLTLDLN
ncbi:hypothetical protein BAE44_0023799, partial [Dichanthelium oligosanthes]